MKTKASILFLTAILTVTTTAISAQDIRIKFPKGRTSTTVSGRISSGGRICYFAKAKEGQSFKATLSSKSGKVQIFESGDTSYAYVIEQSGDQSVCVDNLAGATTYTMTVSIR